MEGNIMSTLPICEECGEVLWELEEVVAEMCFECQKEANLHWGYEPEEIASACQNGIDLPGEKRPQASPEAPESHSK